MLTLCLPLLWDHWTSGYDCDVQDRRRWDGMEVALARLTWLLRSQYAVEKQSIVVLPGQASQRERPVQPRTAQVCRAPFAIRRPERKVTLSVCYHKGRGFVVRGEEYSRGRPQSVEPSWHRRTNRQWSGRLLAHRH